MLTKTNTIVTTIIANINTTQYAQNGTNTETFVLKTYTSLLRNPRWASKPMNLIENGKDDTKRRWKKLWWYQ